MIIAPAGRLVPIASLAGERDKICTDVSGDQGAVSFTEYSQAGFIGNHAVGHKNVADLFAF